MPAKCYHFVTVLSFFCYFFRFSCPRMLALDLIGGLKQGSRNPKCLAPKLALGVSGI